MFPPLERLLCSRSCSFLKENEFPLLQQQHSTSQSKKLRGFTLSLRCLPQLLHAAPLGEPCKALGQSLLGWPSRDSAWNVLIHANEPQICQTTLLEGGEKWPQCHGSLMPSRGVTAFAVGVVTGRCWAVASILSFLS